jgi:hypothetical protein
LSRYPARSTPDACSPMFAVPANRHA